MSDDENSPKSMQKNSKKITAKKNYFFRIAMIVIVIISQMNQTF